MLYLSPMARARLEAHPASAAEPRLGQFRTPESNNLVVPGKRWAADTGMFNPKVRARWEADPEAMWARYVAWLGRATDEERARCLFACLPDVFGSADATWDWSMVKVQHHQLDALGILTAYIVQPVEDWSGVPWDSIDAIFVGGPDEWQHSASCAALIAEAKARAKWVHRGRVNSARRFQLSLDQGVDSVDGTYLCYGWDDLWPKVARWLELRPGLLAPLPPVLHCNVCGLDLRGGALADPRSLWQADAPVCLPCSAQAVDS